MTGVFSPNRPFAVVSRALVLCSILGFAMTVATPALALSELKRIPAPPQQQGSDQQGEEEAPDDEPLQIPMPDPLVNKPSKDARDDMPQQPVEVLSDISKIPAPVARMRELIVEAAASGDIERLRPLLGKGETQTQVSDNDLDPIEVLKSQSGDGAGIEIMAILLDLLSTGFVHVDKGTPEEMYVWPYFAEKPLASLTPPEKVDLFRLVTAGDFAGMEEFGSYNFYRVGITKDGQWKFFVGGD